MPELGPLHDIFKPTPKAENPTLSPELEQEYQGQKEKLSNLLDRDLIWHGTGRKDVQGGVERDILDEMLKKDEDGNFIGIQPHPDPWAGREQTTTSLTANRLYARIYADMHIQAGSNDLLFRDIRGTGIGRTTAPHLLSLLKNVPHITKQRRNTREWMEKKTGTRVDGKLWREAFKFGKRRSGIEGDYPILIAAKSDSIKPVKLPRFMQATETRTDRAISIEDINHIEVPLKYVEDTIAFIKERGADIKVIPREFGERYSTEFSHKSLIKGTAFRKRINP